MEIKFEDTLKKDQAAVVFNDDGTMEILLPSPGEDAEGDDECFVSTSGVLATAVGFRMDGDEEWGKELIDWYFKKVEEFDDED